MTSGDQDLQQLGRAAWGAVHDHGAFRRDFPDEEYFEEVGREVVQAQVNFARGSAPVGPDCRDGKHPACDGRALDAITDNITTCGCACHQEAIAA